MLGRELAQRVENVSFNLVGLDGSLSFGEGNDLGSVVCVVDGVMDGDSNLKTAFVGNSTSSNTSPHRLSNKSKSVLSTDKTSVAHR